MNTNEMPVAASGVLDTPQSKNQTHTPHQDLRGYEQQQDGEAERRNQRQRKGKAWIKEKRYTNTQGLPNISQLHKTTSRIKRQDTI